MTINDRIQIIRKEQKLSMESFGQRLGITKAAVSNIEKGKRNVTMIMQKAICREFLVNEEWLLKGIGERYAYSFKPSLLERIKNVQDILNKTMDDCYAINRELKSWNNDCRITETIRSINIAILNLGSIDLTEENNIDGKEKE